MKRKKTMAASSEPPACVATLSLARDYWLKTIHPYIEDRALDATELYVASDGYDRLQKAKGDAEDWNRSAEGATAPVPAELLNDLDQDRFREPEGRYRDDTVKPETLAAIAAPLVKGSRIGLSPSEAVRCAHDLWMAAARYINSLPERTSGAASSTESLTTGLSWVSFSEIVTSNRSKSGRLPLLPPAGQKRKGRDSCTEDTLSVPAIRVAVKRGLLALQPSLTPDEYEREQRQEQELRTAGQLTPSIPKSYEDYQADLRAIIDDCLRHDKITLQHLGELRWRRFIESRVRRRGIASARKAGTPNSRRRNKSGS